MSMHNYVHVHITCRCMCLVYGTCLIMLYITVLGMHVYSHILTTFSHCTNTSLNSALSELLVYVDITMTSYTILGTVERERDSVYEYDHYDIIYSVGAH